MSCLILSLSTANSSVYSELLIKWISKVRSERSDKGPKGTLKGVMSVADQEHRHQVLVRELVYVISNTVSRRC